MFLLKITLAFHLDLAGVLTSSLAASSKRRVENVENIVVSMDPLLKLHHLRYRTFLLCSGGEMLKFLYVRQICKKVDSL